MARRSEHGAVPGSVRVVIGDSMGEMLAYYAAADVVVIGGSLLAFGGGQAALPLIERIAVGETGWLSPQDFATAVAFGYVAGEWVASA